ncbi:MAG: hypothetical protein AAF514_00490 [Verrucomicrobiota bacterium]
MDNQPLTPPSHPTKPSAWPVALGIIAIVFGLFGAGASAIGVFGQQAMVGLAASGMGEAGEAYKEMAASWFPKLLIVAAFTILVAFLLLVGGIVLLRRKPSGVKLLKVWAVLKILLICVSIPINYLQQKEMMGLMSQVSPDSSPAANISVNTGAEVGVIVGLIFGIIWGLILPIFFLIWFSLKKIKEEVATWA